MCPTVKFSNNLVIFNPRCNNGANHLVWGHAGYTNVCRAPNAVLAGIFAANGIIHGLTAERTVDYNGLAA
jgi:hypothetical protein